MRAYVNRGEEAPEVSSAKVLRYRRDQIGIRAFKYGSMNEASMWKVTAFGGRSSKLRGRSERSFRRKRTTSPQTHASSARTRFPSVRAPPEHSSGYMNKSTNDRHGGPAFELLRELPQAAIAGSPGLAFTLKLDPVIPGGSYGKSNPLRTSVPPCGDYAFNSPGVKGKIPLTERRPESAGRTK